MLAACASRAPKKHVAIVAGPPSRPASTAALRTNEQLREYRFGRYVDPGDPLVMHEEHPLYRVETTAAWNLRPSSVGSPALRNTAALPSASANDAVVAEVNKQRAATRIVTEQTATLNQRLGELAQVATQSQELAKQSLALKRDVAGLRERLEALDAQLRERKPPEATRPQQVEDKW